MLGVGRQKMAHRLGGWNMVKCKFHSCVSGSIC